MSNFTRLRPRIQAKLASADTGFEWRRHQHLHTQLLSEQMPSTIDRARIDRQIRELALEHAAGSLGDEAYLARLKVLRQQRDAIVERTAPGLPGQRAVEWLRALGESFQAADVPKEKADLMHAIYERITVAAPRSWVSG